MKFHTPGMSSPASASLWLTIRSLEPRVGPAIERVFTRPSFGHQVRSMATPPGSFRVYEPRKWDSETRLGFMPQAGTRRPVRGSRKLLSAPQEK